MDHKSLCTCGSAEIAAVLGTNNITELVKDGDIWRFQVLLVKVINPTEEQLLTEATPNKKLNGFP